MGGKRTLKSVSCQAIGGGGEKPWSRPPPRPAGCRSGDKPGWS